MSAAAQLFHHEHHRFGREEHELGLAFEGGMRDAPGVNGQALDDFFDLLRNPVEREGEGLDVLALEWRDEGLAELFSHRVPDTFFLPASLDELIERAVRRSARRDGF